MVRRWGAAMAHAVVRWVPVVAGCAVSGRYGVRVAARGGLRSNQCRGICPPCAIRIVPVHRNGTCTVVPDTAHVMCNTVLRQLGPPGLAIAVLTLVCPPFVLVLRVISVGGLHGLVPGWPVVGVDF